MATKAKPVLVKVGKHFIDPSQVRTISKVRRDLYVIKFKDDPNPDYPVWAHEKDIGILLEQFKITVSDEEDEEEEE